MASKAETNPSPLMYTFVILVFIIGATFVFCHKDYRIKKFDEELVGKTESEKIGILEDQIKYLNTDTYRKVENLTISELTDQRDYIVGKNANSLATVMLMAFFVLIAVCIAILKFIAITVLGFKSLKNIKGNL